MLTFLLSYILEKLDESPHRSFPCGNGVKIERERKLSSAVLLFGIERQHCMEAVLSKAFGTWAISIEICLVALRSY